MYPQSYIRVVRVGNCAAPPSSSVPSWSHSLSITFLVLFELPSAVEQVFLPAATFVISIQRKGITGGIRGGSKKSACIPAVQLTPSLPSFPDFPYRSPN